MNQARAALKKKTQELLSVEGEAEFHSQIKLLNQGVVNYLDVCDTPEKCDEYLTKVMVQIEELEGRFAEFDEFLVELSAKREEVYSAFDGKKVALVEARNRRAAALMSAADRILKGIETRVRTLESTSDIHSYFAADLMVEKVRDIVDAAGRVGGFGQGRRHSEPVEDDSRRFGAAAEGSAGIVRRRAERHSTGKASFLGQRAAARPDDGPKRRPHAVPSDGHEFLGRRRRSRVSCDA